MTKITLHRSLGESLMERLLEAYKNKRGIHRYRPETHAPQHLFIPEGMKRGTREWRRWLARAAGTDFRTQSFPHYARHAALRVKHPPLYTREAAQYLPTIVGDILRMEGFSKWRFMSQSLPILAGTIAQEFGDDPLNLYRFGSIEALMKFKYQFKRESGYDGIPGFGPKIASLYAVFLEEAGLMRVEDALPVDVWVQQIFVATGIVEVHEDVQTDVLENAIRLFLCDLCARKGWSRIDLCHALWFLGNKGCKECHSFADRETSCTLWADCRGRAVSRSYRLKGEWGPSNERYRKGGSRIFLLEPVSADSPQQPLFKKD